MDREFFADQSIVRARFGTLAAISLMELGVFGACSTTEMAPPPVLPAVPPTFVRVPHPGGYGIGDLNAIFMTPGSPKLDDLRDCDSDFKKLKTSTPSSAEHVEGARELVRRDPDKYHWCFYGKILKLENELKAQSYLDEKQKSVLETYGTLTPMARAFMAEFHDSRYLRWAIKHYRSVSEWVFYRKVELTPQTTSELVEAANPFGMLREPASSTPVLEKYGIAPPASAAPAAQAPVTGPNGLPGAPQYPVPEPPEPEAETALPPLPPDPVGGPASSTPPPPPTPERAPSSSHSAPSAWEIPAGPRPFPDNAKFPAGDALENSVPVTAPPPIPVRK